MIRNIIFDIGNVLVDYCWQEHIAGYGFLGGMARRIGKAMMESPVWNELDRGLWTNEELLAGFIRNDPELEQEIRLVFSDLSTLVKEREGSRGWLRALKKEGFWLYYLSNYSARAKNEAAGQITFLEEMDGGIMSYREGLIKPDPAIYRLLLERYGLNAQECVFLDDSPANVEAAVRLGIRGIQVKSQEQAMRDLQELLRKENV